MLQQRGIDRLPVQAAYLADRYRALDQPEAATFAGRVRAAADGRPVNEFEEVIERGLDRLPHVGLWVDPMVLIRTVWWTFCSTAVPRLPGW